MTVETIIAAMLYGATIMVGGKMYDKLEEDERGEENDRASED